MDNIIEIMARADVEWQGSGTLHLSSLTSRSPTACATGCGPCSRPGGGGVQHFGGRARRLDVSLNHSCRLMDRSCLRRDARAERPEKAAHPKAGQISGLDREGAEHHGENH
jgi:hypothetical protein